MIFIVSVLVLPDFSFPKQYLEREWTIHERRSAQERMLKEKGSEYILPVKIDDSELPGYQQP